MAELQPTDPVATYLSVVDHMKEAYELNDTTTFFFTFRPISFNSYSPLFAAEPTWQVWLPSDSHYYSVLAADL